MISTLKREGIIILLFLLFIFNSCISAEERAMQERDKVKLASHKNGPQVYTVVIKEMKFTPETIAVQKGDTVIWKNRDLVTHCITEENTKSWTSSNIVAGSSWKMVIQEPANYFCAIHQVMKGKITIE